MTKNHQTGRRGEDIALAYLQSRGYKFHDRNVRIGRDEIDLVMFDPDDSAVVFVEVKSRSTADADFPPETNLTAHKKEKMHRAAVRWIAEKEYDGAWRLDVVCVACERVTDHLRQVTSA